MTSSILVFHKIFKWTPILQNNMRIMVIAAHPDDEILGLGATMAKHIANKDKVFVLILGQCIAPNRNAEIEQIKKHTLNAVKIIGLEKAHVHFADLGVKENKMLDELPLWQIATAISKILNDTKPESKDGWIFFSRFATSRSAHSKYPTMSPNTRIIAQLK